MNTVITDESTIDKILSRRVDAVYPSREALKKVLMSGKKLRIYQGFDPTGKKLHLGHSIGMRNLQAFAELGHEVIVLFGNGTVLVGDPSERDTGRKLITQDEIEENLAPWKAQVEKVIDFSKVSIKFNGDWLIPMTLKDIVWLGSHVSATQLFKRDSFQARLDKGDAVWYHETMYPLLQGYDSVAMDVDLEIGGTDQMFNMLVGRELQKKINNKDKFVITNPMVLGTDGKQMSKTSGNCIWLNDSPEDMYGKTMSIPDEQIALYTKMFTDDPVDEAAIKSDPMSAKKSLAFKITLEFHGHDQAKAAQNTFTSTVQKGAIPDNIDSLVVPSHKISLLELVKSAQPSLSSSQVKRLIKQGGVELNQKKLTDPNLDLELGEGDILKCGKRSYWEITHS